PKNTSATSPAGGSPPANSITSTSGWVSAMGAAAAGPLWLITRSATGADLTGTGKLPGVRSEVVVFDRIPFSEGPVWCDDGTLVVTSVAAGALFRVWPNEQRTEA